MSAGIKGMCHHAQLIYCHFTKLNEPSNFVVLKNNNNNNKNPRKIEIALPSRKEPCSTGKTMGKVKRKRSNVTYQSTVKLKVNNRKYNWDPRVFKR